MQKQTIKHQFFQYILFQMFGMLGLSCYILADTFFVSQGLGAMGLAALNLAIPVYSLIHGCGLMLGMGGATRYTILKSQKDAGGANHVFSNALFLCLGFSLLFVCMGAFLATPITRGLGADAQTFTMTKTYLQTLLFFSPAFLCNDLFLCFIRNDGNPSLAMAAMIIGSLANIFLDYVFIFPLQMGIFGAVLATGLSPIISMGILSLHFWKKKCQFRFLFITPAPALSCKIIALGFPSLIAELSSGIVMIVFNGIFLQLQGNMGVAAYGIIANLSLVVLAMDTGIAQGAQPLFSKAYGQNSKETMAMLFRWACFFMLALAALLYACLFFFAPPIAAAFNRQQLPLLQQLAVSGIKLYFLAMPFAGFNLLLSGYFSSMERPGAAQAISLSRGFFLILPLAFLFSKLWGVSGAFLSFPATELATAVFGFFFLFHSRNAVLSPFSKKQKSRL